MVEIRAAEQNIEKKNEKKWRQPKRPWDNIKHTNIHIGVLEGEVGEKGPEKIFEEMIAEKFSNMEKEMVN